MSARLSYGELAYIWRIGIWRIDYGKSAHGKLEYGETTYSQIINAALLAKHVYPSCFNKIKNCETALFIS